MADKIADRLLWAVDVMDIQPADHVLEIGCGHGVAVSLVCEKLVTGTITALDRSEKMINMARRRNKECDKADFHVAALAEAGLSGKTFNKIFAFHVNVFLRQPEKELAVIKNLLAADGVLYLFNQPMTADKVPDVAAQLKHNLTVHGFSVTNTLFGELPSGTAICVMATR